MGGEFPFHRKKTRFLADSIWKSWNDGITLLIIADKVGGTTITGIGREAVLVTREGWTAPLRTTMRNAAFRSGGNGISFLKGPPDGIDMGGGAVLLKTITRPGSSDPTGGCAHARGGRRIFRIVPVSVDWLPDTRGQLNMRAIPATDVSGTGFQYRVVSAGNGMRVAVQNLHCSELARWPSAIAETLAPRQ